jgi:hypothetical protein
MVASVGSLDLEAIRLYQKAIRKARKNGFLQNELDTSELAAQWRSWPKEMGWPCQHRVCSVATGLIYGRGKQFPILDCDPESTKP